MLQTVSSATIKLHALEQCQTETGINELFLLLLTLGSAL
jgi:hypothetical protein